MLNPKEREYRVMEYKNLKIDEQRQIVDGMITDLERRHFQEVQNLNALEADQALDGPARDAQASNQRKQILSLEGAIFAHRATLDALKPTKDSK